ncbi:MAG: methylenetetrahydrofolate reductase [Woeseia sp.]
MKTFREAIRTRDFAVTVRLGLRPETDAAAIREKAKLLRNHVDAVLVTDNQLGMLHMSTLAASVLLVQNRVDPIMQLSCRNRNRIALLNDLFGAAALGVTSLLLVRGHKVPKKIKPRPKVMLDLTATELIATAMTMKSDEEVGAFSDFFIGGAVTLHDPDPDWVPNRLIAKIDAGAQFVQMPVCMDMDLLRRYMKHLVANKLIRHVSVIASTALLPSAEAACWLRDNWRNAQIPDAIIDRLDQSVDSDKEGIKICVEHLQELAEIPGVSGTTIVPGANLAVIPDLIRTANLTS